MAWNGSGTFSIAYAGNPVVNGTTISSTWANGTFGEVATGITNCIAKDGQNAATANLPMGNNKHTGVANATARDQYAAFGQVQDSTATYLTSVSGADTITASLTGLAAYAAGQTFQFVSAGANTGAVTLNINGLGAKAVTKQGTTALVAGDIASGVTVEVIYDGTRFQLVNLTATSTLTALTVSGSITGPTGLWNTSALYIGASSATWDERIGATRSTNAVCIGGYSSSASYTSSVLRLQTETVAGTGWLLIDGRSSGGTQQFTVAGNGNVTTGGTVAATGAITENSTRVFSRNSQYTGTSAITSNSVHTFPHGLGAKPVLVQASVSCTSNDNGYVVGDEIDITANASGTTQMCITYCDATNVYVIVKNGISVINPTSVGSSIAGLTLASWTLRVRAWY